MIVMGIQYCGPTKKLDDEPDREWLSMEGVVQFGTGTAEPGSINGLIPNDVVSIWMYVGLEDIKEGGKITIAEINISYGYTRDGTNDNSTKNNDWKEEDVLDRVGSTNHSNTITNMMLDVSQRVSDELEIPISWSELLLEEYQWRPATAIAAFNQDPKVACEKSGLPYRKLYRARQLALDGAPSFGLRQGSTGIPLLTTAVDDVSSVTNSTLVESTHCLICYEDAIPNVLKLRGLGCGHVFCDECWCDHVDTLMLKKSIVDVKLLKCPMASVGTDGCSARVPHDVVDEVASIRAKKLYNILIVKDFVNDHNTVLKWCPGRSCECVVERMRRTVQKTTDNKNNESIETRTAVVNFNAVNCNVGLHFFCFECGELPHDPCDCNTYSKWLDLVEQGTGVDPRTGASDTSAIDRLSEQWIKKNTKQCPECNLAVLKADGCNHMTCRNPKCNHQWCWICCKPWSDCGGTYNCKQISGDGNNENANKLISKALQESKETIEYFGSYLATENSLRMETNLLSGNVLRKRVAALTRLQAQENKGKKENDLLQEQIDPSFVMDAVVCLLKNRYLLRGLTAYRHYLFETDQEEDDDGKKTTRTSTGSRGSLSRAIHLTNTAEHEKLKRQINTLHHELSVTTEKLANVAGRRTFRVAAHVVVDCTRHANVARRRMKNYLRASVLGQRTVLITDGLSKPGTAVVCCTRDEDGNAGYRVTLNQLEVIEINRNCVGFANGLRDNQRVTHVDGHPVSNFEEYRVRAHGRDTFQLTVILAQGTDYCFNCHANTTEDKEENVHELLSQLQCGKDHMLVEKDNANGVYNRHKCDLCRVYIGRAPSLRRCGQSCDYDVCNDCWTRHENIKTKSLQTNEKSLATINGNAGKNGAENDAFKIGELVTVLDNDESETVMEPNVLYQVVGLKKSRAEIDASNSLLNKNNNNSDCAKNAAKEAKD